MDLNSEEQLRAEQFKGVYAKIEANYTIVNEKTDHNHHEVKIILNQILDQTKKTNGRVNKIEDNYVCKEDYKSLKNSLDDFKAKLSFFEAVSKYPKLAGLALIGLCVIGMLGGFAAFIKVF